MPVAPLLAEAVRRLHAGETLTDSARFLRLLFQPHRIGGGKPQISTRERRPFLRRARIGFEQMRDGETRPQRRAMAAIKHKKLLRVAVVQRMHDAAAQIFAGPGGAKPLALDAKERYFVERIDHAQARIEFQTVDNAHRIAEANMFGAQVAMPVDDAPRSHALGEKFAALGQKAALHRVDVAHASGGQLKARVKQHAAIVGEAAP